MGSRIRENPAHVFECFFEVVIPNENEKRAWILQKYPEEFEDQEVLKSVPEFSCPCEFTNTTIHHFSFVLTSLDSKWSFGYCRHAPDAPTLFVLLSHLPWHETFYKILNQVSDLTNDKESGLLTKFLESLYNSPVPDPGLNLHVSYNQKEFVVYCPNHFKIPSIPENRNLTEYFNAIDANNMMVVFASMLHERRILVVSKKLSRLSACVQAANSLIYPMHWQHIFIPVLPKHLVDYLSAPMPYLIGVPAVTLEKFRQSELSEVVILDADNNRVKTPFKDLETLPPDIVSSLKRSLKNPNMMLGDGVSRAFMTALVKLIGGYRDSLKVTPGESISFDADAFIQTRPASVQPFLETMLHLQIFQQFIENRLDMLNSGIGFNDEFEYEVNTYEVHSNNLKTQYKEWVTTMKKEGGAFLKNVKSKTNPAVKHAYKSVKDKGKRAYKDIRSRIHDIQKQPSQSDLRFDHNFEKPRSAPSSPTSIRANPFPIKRISYNHSDSSKSGVLDGINLPNARAVAGIRRYKILAPDEISLPEESTDDRSSPSLQHIDMDLMEDLRDVIYRRCSVSSDNINSFGLMDEIIEDVNTSEVVLGFSDSFCSSSDFLPAPIPPPRSRKNIKPPIPNIPLNSRTLSEFTDISSVDEPLIQFESLDEVALFDPLEENNVKDTQLLSFLTPQSSSDSRVTELKNTIQQLTSNSVQQMNSHQPMGFYPPGSYCAPRVARPGLVIPRFPVPMPVAAMHPQSNGFSNFESTLPEVKPPLPPKTKKPTSTFFVSATDLSDADKNLLDDYGLSNSPLFQKGAEVNSQQSTDLVGNLSSIQEGSSSAVLKPMPLSNAKGHPSSRPKHKEKAAQPTWQKFT